MPRNQPPRHPPAKMSETQQTSVGPIPVSRKKLDMKLLIEYGSAILDAGSPSTACISVRSQIGERPVRMKRNAKGIQGTRLCTIPLVIALRQRNARRLPGARRSRLSARTKGIDAIELSPSSLCGRDRRQKLAGNQRSRSTLPNINHLTQPDSK